MFLRILVDCVYSRVYIQNKYMIDYKNQLTSIDRTTNLINIPNGAIGYILFQLFQETKFNFLMHIVENNTEIEFLKSEIKFYDDSINILEFPDWDTVPYDVSSPSVDIQAKRIETLYKISEKCKTILLISKKSMIQKIINPSDFNKLVLHVKVGQNLSVENIVELLDNNCYNRVDTAVALGDYAVNNGKIDIVTFQSCSFRITINKNKVEELRFFNPITQIVHDNYEDILILPMGEVVLNKTNIQNFRGNYRSEFGMPDGNDKLYSTISNDKTYEGMENWLPLFYNFELSTIFDYIPKDAIITHNNILEKIAEEYEDVKKYHKLRDKDSNYKLLNIESMYIDITKLNDLLENYINITFNKGSIGMDLGFEFMPKFYESNENKNAFTQMKEFI